ncbi:auxin response factor 19-like [Humulus lupulus]|uniref:auxin response factor 19-like n=1 Tax=Humulus lupulus TaxID=3486 RepID=UPI002B40AC26|nr:auxin response factor 19-like [Humulus lupulus]
MGFMHWEFIEILSYAMVITIRALDFVYFMCGKRHFAGDSVLFIRDEKQQLLLGIRRAYRQPTNLSSSVLSSDSMHIGILAAATHAAANNSPFTVFYNPSASPSEFVIPLAKYYKTVWTKEYGIGLCLDFLESKLTCCLLKFKNVGWDESIAGERRNRVSIWEIEPVTAPFLIFPLHFSDQNVPDNWECQELVSDVAH